MSEWISGAKARFRINARSQNQNQESVFQTQNPVVAARKCMRVRSKYLNLIHAISHVCASVLLFAKIAELGFVYLKNNDSLNSSCYDGRHYECAKQHITIIFDEADAYFSAVIGKGLGDFCLYLALEVLHIN